MEQITAEDKIVLDRAKYSKDIAAYHSKVQELEHQILVLKLAMKYKLQEGDNINDDTTISRSQRSWIGEAAKAEPAKEVELPKELSSQ